LTQPRRPPTPTLFPYTTLFRSRNNGLGPRRLSQESEAEKATPPPPAAGERRPASRDDDPGDRRVGPESYSWPLANSRTIAPTKLDRKSTRLNSSHLVISYAVFC